MHEVIFMLSGLSDVEVAGNQSLKNGIKFLSEFGYKIHVFTFMPSNYPNLQDPRKIFSSNVEFHRLPGILPWIITTGKKIKDKIGRQKGDMSPLGESNKEPGTYLREYNPIGRMLYLIFLFALYLPAELLRGLVYSFVFRPSLIYGVNCQGALVASLLGRILKRPVITRFHGVCISEYDLTNRRNRFFVLDEIVGLKAKAHALVMTNDGTKGDQILEMLKVEKNKIFFWMNGMDIADLKLPDDWTPDEIKKELGIGGKKVILMLARLTHWKGVEKGIHCFHKLVNDHRMENVVLLIGGDGPGRQEFENLANKLGVKESIRFLGGIPHKEVAKYFSMADIFLSLYDVSNLGNPMLEALYFGVPIITCNDGTTEHLLKNYYNCLYVENEDVQDKLPLNVKKLLEDKPLRAEIGQNAKKTFNEKILSWEERMKLEDNLIKKILDDKALQ